jgi:hypothetical protein
MSNYGDRPRRAATRGRSSGSGPSGAVTAVLVVVGMAVLFVAGFALSTVLRGGGDDGGSASPSTSGAPQPQPCETVTIAPVEVLPKPADVTVNVYNSTSRAGLAAATADVLQQRGFVIGTIDNDPLGKTIKGVAEIRYGAKGLKAAELMAFYLPGATLVNDKRKTADIDVSLGEGFDSVAPQADVDKALNTPTPFPTGPGCSSAPAPAPESSSESAPAESSAA